MNERYFELVDVFDALFDKISDYCNKRGCEINVREKIAYWDENLPYGFQLEENPYKRRLAGIARLENGYILLSRISVQMIWYIAWLAYRIKNNCDVANSKYIIQQLIVVDKGEENDSLDKFSDWDSSELDNIFCNAVGFLICHELGHVVHNHPKSHDENGDLRDTEMLKANELQADSFAARCILEIADNDELAKYGILVAQLALWFIRNKDVNYDTHPCPDKRLENIERYFEFTGRMPNLIGIAKDLSQEYIEKRFV